MFLQSDSEFELAHCFKDVDDKQNCISLIFDKRRGENIIGFTIDLDEARAADKVLIVDKETAATLKNYFSLSKDQIY